LYQGRFKSFPVEGDEHYLIVSRYVERNALRAGLVRRAENWRWSSLAQRVAAETKPTLTLGPLPWPRNWLEQVNRALTEKEVEAVQRSLERGQPYGSDAWIKRAAGQLGLASTLRPRGRPKKKGS
jgi:putative transposase